MTDTPRCPSLLLAAELDLQAAEPLRERLAEALDAGGELSVDGSKVERVSTACLQVLVAAAHQARRTNLAFLVVRPSTVLERAVADLALHDALPLRS